MRSFEEMKEFIEKNDILGMTYGDIIDCLPYEKAKEYLTNDYIEKIESGEAKWEEYNEYTIIRKIKDYLEFAWAKANNQRGLSASRSIKHFQNWFYMFNNKYCDKLVKSMKAYEYYGKPWLVIISELVNVKWKKFDNTSWTNGNNDYLNKRQINTILEEYKNKIPFNEIKEYLNEFLIKRRKNEKQL